MKELRTIILRDWRHGALLLFAAVFPLLIALLLAGFVPVRQIPPLPPIEDAVALQVLEGLSARELSGRFEQMGYRWPLQGEVPRLEVNRLPTDMNRLAGADKKALFFRLLLPLVVAENRRVLQERRWLEALMRYGYPATAAQQARMQQLLERYGLEGVDQIDEALLAQLYRRVDIIPAGLALAQAANESGWGTSRFSREANNLFGHWTFNAAEGILPLRRKEGAGHYVRRFATLRESVRAYFNNLNRNRAYRRLRQLRAAQREQGLVPDALTLAEGLQRYSERGKAYVADIQALIRGNGLNELGPLHLARSATAD